MTLPADSHVHSEWSWDTGGPQSNAVGRMRATCAQAVKIGRRKTSGRRRAPYRDTASLIDLAAYITRLDLDFAVESPPELRVCLESLAARFTTAAAGT